MAKSKLTEAILIIKNIDSSQVKALYELYKNKEVVEPILALMDQVKQMDLKKILDAAGGVNSLDKMIDTSVDQSFRRGRISFSVLLRALLINSEAEMERREAKK